MEFLELEGLLSKLAEENLPGLAKEVLPTYDC